MNAVTPTSSLERDPAATSTDAPAIRLRGLTRAFGEVRAVDDVDLEVPPGSFLVLLGPSGCGKTTTLRMLAGLDSPTGGEIHLNGRLAASGETGHSVPPAKRGAGLVFQSYALWPHMTVRANIEWPLKIARLSRSRRIARADEVMRMLSIEELATRYPGEISGGQQQRVAIARTLAPEPSVLLFDEPLSNLDAKLRVETRSELLRLHRATGATSVYVTHDQVEAMTMASHVALMRNGRVEQFGSPYELVARPASAFVATFMGTPPANLLPATVVAGDVLLADGTRVAGATAEDGSEVQVMYRPDVLSIDPHGVIALEVLERSPMAGRWVLAGLAEGRRVSVALDHEPSVATGEVLRLGLPPVPDALFHADGHRVDDDAVTA